MKESLCKIKRSHAFVLTVQETVYTSTFVSIVMRDIKVIVKGQRGKQESLPLLLVLNS